MPGNRIETLETALEAIDMAMPDVTVMRENEVIASMKALDEQCGIFIAEDSWYRRKIRDDEFLDEFTYPYPTSDIELFLRGYNRTIATASEVVKAITRWEKGEGLRKKARSRSEYNEIVKAIDFADLEQSLLSYARSVIDDWSIADTLPYYFDEVVDERGKPQLIRDIPDFSHVIDVSAYISCLEPNATVSKGELLTVLALYDLTQGWGVSQPRFYATMIKEGSGTGIPKINGSVPKVFRGDAVQRFFHDFYVFARPRKGAVVSIDTTVPHFQRLRKLKLEANEQIPSQEEPAPESQQESTRTIVDITLSDDEFTPTIYAGDLRADEGAIVDFIESTREPIFQRPKARAILNKYLHNSGRNGTQRQPLP